MVPAKWFSNARFWLGQHLGIHLWVGLWNSYLCLQLTRLLLIGLWEEIVINLPSPDFRKFSYPQKKLWFGALSSVCSQPVLCTHTHAQLCIQPELICAPPPAQPQFLCIQLHWHTCTHLLWLTGQWFVRWKSICVVCHLGVSCCPWAEVATTLTIIQFVFKDLPALMFQEIRI